MVLMPKFSCVHIGHEALSMIENNSEAWIPWTFVVVKFQSRQMAAWGCSFLGELQRLPESLLCSPDIACLIQL
jgi:hypothetical protein